MFHFYLTTSTPTPITNYIAFFLIIKQLISFPVDAFLTEILPLAPVDSNTLAKHLSQYINITFPVVLFARAYFIYDFYTQDISHGQETLVENSKWDNLSRGGRDTLGQIRGEDNWDTSLGHLSGTPLWDTWPTTREAGNCIVLNALPPSLHFPLLSFAH